ncbi:hypothetical protein [Micromonospora endolithica]|uniref:DNA repair protein n=1 Tax=Micromonospora endolithica TaxID=230091 RepID=A0A3A9ZMC1_9ACTN|nr:hypothetical protein [Micromonospora endolithica]RKN49460.1 hypothetical protein D7223_08200 [Micromonospora endolithica]
MPNQPNDRYQQDPAQLWSHASGSPERFPAQPPYRGHRTSALCWGDLNKLPAGVSSRRHLNPR